MTIGVGAFSCSIMWWCWSISSQIEKFQMQLSQDNIVSTKLLSVESTAVMLTIPSISTITFYQAESATDIAEVVEYLKSRMTEMVEKNPWLEGWIIKHPLKDQVYLQHHKFSGKLKQSTFRCIEMDSIDERMEYALMASKIGHLTVKDGNTVLSANRRKQNHNQDNIDESLFRVTLIKNPHNNKFAILFSVSHIIADGHTFYTLYEMLSNSSHNKVRKLIIERDHEFIAKLEMATDGNDTLKWVFSFPVSLNFLSSLLFNPSPKALSLIHI